MVNRIEVFITKTYTPRLVAAILLLATMLPTSSQIVVNELMVSNIDMFVSPSGNFDGWLELYNEGDKAVDIEGYYFSDDINDRLKWRYPASQTISRKGFLVVWFDHDEDVNTQVGFKLDADGGNIYISDSNGSAVASITYPPTITRTSYARKTDGSSEWGFAAMPTPAASNNESVYATTQLSTPQVSKQSQWFDGEIDGITITADAGDKVIYTTDGTLPTLYNGKLYDGTQLAFDSTTTLRVRQFKNGMLPSDVATVQYLKRDGQQLLPVVAVTADDTFLYSDELGIFVKGTNGKTGNGQTTPCNWNMDWERPATFSFFDEQGRLLFQHDVLLENSGGWSRAYEPHSFKLKGNKMLGTGKNLEYQFFADKQYLRHRTLLMRNGGNDHECRIKDAALQTIVRQSGIDIDQQAYLPVVHYINGRYAGLINLREPSNKHYVYANYGWSDDEIDFLEMPSRSQEAVKAGDSDAFMKWYAMANDEKITYDDIRKIVDVDEWATYMAVELFLGNNDWGSNNIKWFRHKDDNGRFRFILFDLDAALLPTNSFKILSMYEGDKEVRLFTIFTQMLKYDDFRRRFIDAYCIMAASVFMQDRALPTIDLLARRIEPVLEKENISVWTTIDAVKSLLKKRIANATQNLLSYAPLCIDGSMVRTVNIGCNEESAHLTLNGQRIPYGDFRGDVILPATIEAITPAGFRFEGWNDSKGNCLSKSLKLDCGTAGNDRLIATFTRLTDAERKMARQADVVINEVCVGNKSCVNDYFKRTAWLELYNITDETIDLSGYYISNDVDNKQKFLISGDENTLIMPHGYKTVWLDNKVTKKQLHVDVPTDRNGGTLLLTSPNGEQTDVFEYGKVEENMSYCRYPDGCATIYSTNVMTIDRENVPTSYMTLYSHGVDDIDEVATDETIYMHRTDKGLWIESCSGDVDITISSCDGVVRDRRKIEKGQQKTFVDLSDMQQGIYIIGIETKNGNKKGTKIVITQKK